LSKVTSIYHAIPRENVIIPLQIVSLRRVLCLRWKDAAKQNCLCGLFDPNNVLRVWTTLWFYRRDNPRLKELQTMQGLETDKTAFTS